MSVKFVKKTIVGLGAIFVIFLCTLLIIGISTDNKSEKVEFEDTSSSETTNLETSNTTTLENTTTQKSFLSDTCDKVLASGSTNGDFYELVANQKEDYNGTEITIGVIKNNEWLIPLTKQMPFLDDDNKLLSGGADIYGFEPYPSYFYYVGNGCFLNQYWTDVNSPKYTILNSNNEKIFYLDEQHDDFVLKYELADEYISDNGTITQYNDGISKERFVNNEKGLYIVVYHKVYDNTVNLLDSKTMKTSEIYFDNIPNDIAPLSEEMFFCRFYDSKGDKQGFFNINGEMIIDLSEFEICNTNNMIFLNGKCTFSIENEANHKYLITIDKTGKVIDSEVMD